MPNTKPYSVAVAPFFSAYMKRILGSSSQRLNVKVSLKTDLLREEWSLQTDANRIAKIRQTDDYQRQPLTTSEIEAEHIFLK